MPKRPAHQFIRAWTQYERLNFLLTNRIPRRLVTRFMGWYSSIESPTLTRLSIALWRIFDGDLDLGESRQQEFKSLRECFIRELKEGARSVDSRRHVAVSPCDAIVGACGRVEGTRVFQAKGFPYEIGDLIPEPALRSKYRDGTYVTLRLKASMYHRFHAPVDCRVEEITYISGDTWNVNPIALQRIEKLFCKNERAVVELKLDPVGNGDVGVRNRSITLVPVAAILVASMKFHCLPRPLDLRYRGPHRIPCSARYRRGEEMGYFQQGSTIIVFASAGYRLADGVTPGTRVAMGQALLVEQGTNGRNRTPRVRSRKEGSMTFAEELRQQRWDDHRYYHHNRVNQSLHLLSAMCFVTSYILIFIHPAAAVLIGWLLAMVLRQTGHFFFEPQTYDEVNQATHAYKEAVKVGYNLQRKVVLLSIWIAAPVVLYIDPTFLGLFDTESGLTRLLDNLAVLWWAIGLGAVAFRTVHLFFLKGVQSGLVWCTKILTDPFHDIKIYHKAPYYLLKGEMYDDMSEWYDDSVRASMA